MALSWFSGLAAGSPATNFWRWFEKNQAKLYVVDVRSATMFDELSAQLEKVDPALTFEFGPVMPDGKREFVVSAGGIKKAFPAVEDLVRVAPSLPRWQVIKFRPRRTRLHNIEYAEIQVKVEDVRYLLAKDGEKVGVLLLMKGYQKEQHSTYGNIAYLYLDEALGEYTVETQVGFVEIQSFASKHYRDSLPLDNLADQVDDYFRKVH